MYLILVGAGDISSCLIDIALKEGHDIALIERDERLAQAALQQYDIQVFHANIAEDEVLSEAGADQADALIATTYDDAVNLMAMFLGNEHNIKTLISVVNVRAHQRMFERLGAQVLVDPESIIAHYLFKLLVHRRFEDTVTLPGGETVFTTTVGENSSLVGVTPDSARRQKLMPDDMLIVSLERDGEKTVNPTDVALQPGDLLIVFAQTPLSETESGIFSQQDNT